MLTLPTGICWRRSHLDSATYRTLVQLFSLSLDDDDDNDHNNERQEQINHQSPNYNANPPSAALDFHPNPTSNNSEIQKGPILKNSDSSHGNPNKLQEPSADGDMEEEMLQGLMADCAKLLQSHKQDGNVDDDATLLLVGIDSDSPINLEVNNNNNNNQEEKVIDTDKLSSQIEKELELDKGEGKKLDVVNSGPLVQCLGIKKLGDVKDAGEEFEEGEISGEDLELYDEHEDDKLEDDSPSKCLNEDGNTSVTVPTFSNLNFIDGHCTRIVENCNAVMEEDVMPKSGYSNKIGSHGGSLNNLANKGKARPSETKVDEVQLKKKCRPLTEGRKAKKKIAKKRKRARKEREQGVKRLKLLPIVKPKEVKYCDFYLRGNCQKGDACNFSHDIIPLTKSQPCKYFACNSCLKGDDCPFDHQLSNYPCDKYKFTGICIRGDSCKFSHKLPVTEGSVPASVASTTGPSSSSEKSRLVKQLQMNINQSKCSAASRSQSSMHRLLMNAPKIPTQIPNGVLFLSFGEKSNENKQEKSVIALQREKNMFRSMQVYNAANNSSAAIVYNAENKSNNDCTFRKQAATTPEVACGKSITTEITEASKILEEFLYGGTSRM